MKLALVTTPPGASSGIGDYARRLLEHLKDRFEVRVFVETGREGHSLCGIATEPALALFPREHDQVLYLLGNEPEHAFMVPIVRALGGAVDLHDWVLYDLAVAAYPALARGGLAGNWVALCEGGFAQLATYRKDRLDRLQLPLNRSVVRFADAFVVHGEDLRAKILEERNAPTPIAVVPQADSAPRVAEALESFPRPRGARKRLIAQRVRLASRVRAAR